MKTAKYSRYYTFVKPVIENKVAKSVAPYIFSIITIAILVLSALKPTVSTILNLQKSIENNGQILKALKEKGQNLYTGKENYDKLDPNLKDKINGKIPQNAEVASLIRSLRNASPPQASTSALQVQPFLMVDNAGSVTTLALSEIEFVYNTQGPFQDLLLVLRNLQNTDRLIKVDSVVISRSLGPTVLSVTGKAYFLKNI